LQKLDHVALELTAESATRLIPITSLRQHRFPPMLMGTYFRYVAATLKTVLTGPLQYWRGFQAWPRERWVCSRPRFRPFSPL